MDKHTLTPWKVVSGAVVRASDDAPIAHMDRSESASKAGIYPVERDNNAAFIVRACNAHDDLVDALENIRDSAKNAEVVTDIATEAIRKAKGV